MTLFQEFPSLRASRLFVNASADYVDDCFSEGKRFVRCFQPNQTIYSSDTEEIRVGFLLSGSASVYSKNANKRVLLKTAKAGEMFGIANLYATEIAFPTMICAKEETTVLFFSADAFRFFVEHDPLVLRTYLHMQSEKIIYLNQKIATFTAASCECRLAMHLLKNSENGVFSVPSSMSTLARLLGVGRASLYRAMDALLALGLITRTEHHIYIADEEALASFCQKDSQK